MMAKVICVQLVNELGYDLLFQDVGEPNYLISPSSEIPLANLYVIMLLNLLHLDVVWYKNPLDYFNSEHAQKFDVYFQDDGSRQERFAPYSANSGFYFVRR